MNYLDILVRASINVPVAAKNVKLTNEVAQVGSRLMLTTYYGCDCSSLSPKTRNEKSLKQNLLKV